MQSCVLGKDTLSLFPIGAKYFTLCDAQSDKNLQEEPKKGFPALLVWQTGAKFFGFIARTKPIVAFHASFESFYLLKLERRYPFVVTWTKLLLEFSYFYPKILK